MLIIFTIIIFMLLLRKYYFLNKFLSFNFNRHKHSDVKYAHFSKINKINYLLYPKILLTSPQKYTLKAGDALVIPKNWWHWVKTTERSISINFWFNDNIFNKPFQTKYTNNINFDDLNYVVVGVWNTNDDSKNYYTTLNTFFKLNKKYEYVITLDDYILSSYNYLLKKSIKNQVKLPEIIKNYKGEYNYNVWITSNYTDTGLHYDDNDGILCCLSGTKEVILYPPSDTKYLYKLETYDWMNHKAIDFRYNSFTFIKDINGLSSSRLLYETCLHSYEILDKVIKIVEENGINKTVWKCENKKGKLKWKFFKTENKKFVEYYEIYDKPPYKSKKIVVNDKIFVIDNYKNFITNYYEYMKKLGYLNIMDKFKKIILNLYDCYEISVNYKSNNNILVKYLGICKKDFIEFLKKFKYDRLLIYQYENLEFKINNEIMIEYNINDMSIIRTGFYGIV